MADREQPRRSVDRRPEVFLVGVSHRPESSTGDQLPRPIGSSPRSKAVATAAARSLTPSFS